MSKLYFLPFLFSFLLILFGCQPITDPMQGGSEDDKPDGPRVYEYEDENGNIVKYGDCEECKGFAIPSVQMVSGGLSGIVLVDETESSNGKFFKEDGDKKFAGGVYGFIQQVSENQETAMEFANLLQIESDDIGKISEGEEKDEDNVEGESTQTPWGEWVVPPVTRIGACAVEGEDTFHFYLFFQNSYMHKAPDPTFNGDIWHPKWPWNCQVFHVSGAFEQTYESIEAESMAASELECIDPHIQWDGWDESPRNDIQFDKNCNLYFVARTGETNESYLAKFDPATLSLDNDEREVVGITNTDMDIKSWRVNGNGSIILSYWTGHGEGTRVLKVKDGGYEAVQIATSGWDIDAIQDISNENNIILFSPSTVTGARNWQRCFYLFDTTIEDADPTDGVDDRAIELAECSDSMWQEWNKLEQGGDYEEKEALCLDESYHSGGDVYSIFQSSSTGIPYYVGEVRKRNSGTIQCDGYFTENWDNSLKGWCSNGDTTFTQSQCLALDETSWNTDSWFGNGINGDICDTENFPRTQNFPSTETDPAPDRHINNIWCNMSGNESETYIMLAKIDTSNGYPGDIVPYTEEYQEALSAIIGVLEVPQEDGTFENSEKLVLNTYSTGLYQLWMIDPLDPSNKLLLAEDYEIYDYQLIGSEIAFHGLYLPDNKYGLFTIDISSGTPSISEEVITGEVRKIYGLNIKYAINQ